MKPFKINRNSWHYRLNKTVHNEHEHWMEKWEAKHANFCSYWRATMFRLLWVSIMSAFLVALVVMMAVASYMNPWAAAGTVLFSAGLILAVVGLALGHEYLEERKEANPEPKTLIGKQYAAYKSKVCPSVEFDQ
jgi:hypothetical protein